MAEIRVSDLAREAGVSVQSVYRTMERIGVTLDGHVTKKAGVRLVDDAGATMIRERLSQTTVKAEPIATQTPAVVEVPSDSRFDTLEKAVLTLADEVRRSREESSAQIARLVEENRFLRLAILPPADPPRQIIPWRPEARPDPMAGAPWYRRAWFSLVAPERLRRFDS